MVKAFYFSLIVFMLLMVPSVYAEEIKAADRNTPIVVANAQLEKTATNYIAERTKMTGTLDLMDEKANKIRNLRLISIQKESLSGSGVPLVDFRDINTGEIVTVELRMEGGRIKSSKINTITSPESILIDPNKVFTDEEIQNFMKEYVNNQAHLSGSFSLFDEKAQRLRNLELIKLDTQVRRLGVIYISSAEFKDKENQDTLFIDVTVYNNKGKLEIQALRIRHVTPAPVKG